MSPAQRIASIPIHMPHWSQASRYQRAGYASDVAFRWAGVIPAGLASQSSSASWAYLASRWGGR